MLNEAISFSEIEELISGKERNLILQRDEVWRFLGSKHTIEETKEYQEVVRQSDIEIGEILRSLLDEKGVAAQFKLATSELCQKCRNLNNYTRDMHSALSNDLLEKRLAEEGKSMDVIKNTTFFLAVPAAFMTAVKNGFGSDQVNVYEAAEAGIAISAVVLARKKIMASFKTAKASVCDAPRNIKNSFLLFYIKESFKENKIAALKSFRDNASFMSVGISSLATRGRKLIGSFGKSSGPGL